MESSASSLSPNDLYRHMVALIVPRPIAWISTVSKDGIPNLAPYSFFTGVGTNPPSLLFCPVNHPDGSPKDTLRNVLDNGEFVINFTPAHLAEAMNQSSGNYPADQAEFSPSGVTTAPSVAVQPPRVAESPAHIECETLQVINLGQGAGGANIVVGRIVHLHCEDAFLGEDGFPDTERLEPLARLGGRNYSRLGPVTEIDRPRL